MMKKYVLIILGTILATVSLYLLIKPSSNKSIKELMKDKKAVCKMTKPGSETYNNITDTYVAEIFTKKGKIYKISYSDIMKATSLDEYNDSIVIQYYRSIIQDKKNTDGVIYEYNDDFEKLEATYKYTTILPKMTYAEKDEMDYNALLDDDGNLLSIEKLVKKLEKEGYTCIIK